MPATGKHKAPKNSRVTAAVGENARVLLDLAVICAGKTLNEDGQFVTATDAFGKIADLRRTLADLPDDDAP